MSQHQSTIDKAVSRADVYELVYLARTYPGDQLPVDRALAHLVPRLGSNKWFDELAYILTLPERTRPWIAVEAAVQELISLGSDANEAVVSLARVATDATKERAARVLEATGEKERAENLRAALGKGARVEEAVDGKAAPRADEPGRWRAVVGYGLGWIVSSLLLGWFFLGFEGSDSVRFGFMALSAFLLGLVAAGIGLAFTWSSCGWNKLWPGEFVRRLVWRIIVCGIAIGVGGLLVFLALASLFVAET